MVLQIMTRHRWGEKSIISPHKTERECQNGCGILKVTRHEPDNNPPHWQEFWRGLDKIEGAGAPPCTGAPRAYNARDYPL